MLVRILVSALAGLAVAPAARALDHLGRHESTVAGLATPTGAAIDAEGHLWIVERAAHRVRVFSREGEELLRFGSRGSGEGELLFPTGIAIGPAGRVWIADTGNHRVAVFDGTGQALKSVTWKDQYGFVEPVAVAVNEKHLAVADAARRAVFLLNHDGESQDLGMGSGGPFPLGRPTGVAFDRRGHLYVADAAFDRVVKYHPDGRRLKVLGDRGSEFGRFRSPSGVAFHEGELWVVDSYNHRVQVFDTAGNLLGIGGAPALEPREGAGRLFAPAAIAIAGDKSYVAIVEPAEHRVQRFVEGDSESKHEDEAPAEGSFTRFGGAVAADGEWLATIDPETRAVEVANLSELGPQPRTRIELPPARSGQLPIAPDPVDVALDRERRRLWIADRSGQRALAYRIEPRAEGAEPFDVTAHALLLEIDLTAVRTPIHMITLRPPSRRFAIACTPDGGLWFTDVDATDASVRELGPDFAVAKNQMYSTRMLRDPIDLEPFGSGLAVLDAELDRVFVFDRSLKLLRSTPLAAEERASLEPRALATFGEGADARLWVLDGAASRIHEFDALGEHLHVLGGFGDGALEFAEPSGIACSPAGVVYVIDHGNRRGQMLRGGRAFLSMF